MTGSTCHSAAWFLSFEPPRARTSTSSTLTSPCSAFRVTKEAAGCPVPHHGAVAWTPEGQAAAATGRDRAAVSRIAPDRAVSMAERVVETVRKRLRGTVHRVTEGSIVKLKVRY